MVDRRPFGADRRLLVCLLPLVVRLRGSLTDSRVDWVSWSLRASLVTRARGVLRVERIGAYRSAIRSRRRGCPALTMIGNMLKRNIERGSRTQLFPDTDGYENDQRATSHASPS